jgi:tripartite-type tricarboxylate transporter receptor subunit TctC
MVSSRIFAKALVCALLVAVPAAQAQLQPGKPIRIVTSGVGGGTDFTARQLAQGLNAALNRSVIVENRGSSVVPGDTVAKAQPDGHTLLVTSGGILWVLPFYQQVPYDAVKDFAPVSVVAAFPSVLAVNVSVPGNSIKEFIDTAKAKPGGLNFVMTAEGGSAHLAALQFSVMAGVKMVAVPYKNTGTAMSDLLSGQVQLFFSAAGTVMPHVKTGKLKALGITSAKASPLVPDVPPISSVLPGYDMESVYCLFAPAQTPAAVINFLNKEVRAVLNQPDVKERYLGAGIEPRSSTPAELGALRRDDVARMATLIKNSKAAASAGR